MNTQRLQHPLRIILADDGSQHSLAATRLIGDLPLPADSCVTILGVLTPRESSNYSVLQAALEQARNLLEEQRRIHPEQTNVACPTTINLILGSPAEEIIAQAEKMAANLIVMGAKGLRATLGILLGGVAQQVIEYAKFPVLIVRAPYSGLKRVLLVTDGSIYSQHALEYLAGNLQQNSFPLPEGTQLDVVHVLPPIPSPERMVRVWPMGAEYIMSQLPDLEIEADLIEAEEQQGQEILQETTAQLQAANIPCNGILLRGDAATEIIEYARKNQVNLIIAGGRGRSSMRDWLLGSVSRKLVHYADCSVLVIK